MRILVHRGQIDFVHEESIECWCEPYILPDPDEMTLEEFRKIKAAEIIRQERVAAKWVH